MNFNNCAVKSNHARAQHPQQSSSSSQAHKALVIKKFVELISLDVDLDRTRQLLLPHKNIVELPTQLGSLLSQVRRLDLSLNNLTDLAPLSSLTHLTNLNVSHNTNLISLSTLNCPHLLILTASHCNLSDIAGITKCSTTLRTLVINDNNVSLSPTNTNTNTSESTQGKARKQDNSREDYKLTIAYSNYCAIASLQVVETIILSRNVELCKFANDLINDDNSAEKRQCKESATKQTSKESLVTDNKNNAEKRGNKKNIHDANAASAKLHPLSVFAQLSQLRKLSLSQCNICSLPLHWYLPKLNELRLAHNSLESLNPDGVLLQSLKILDVAHNQFHSIATLRRCKYLQQLSLSGNSVYDIYAARDESSNAKLLLETVHNTRTNAKEGVSSTTVNSVNKLKKSAELGADKPRVPLTLQRALHKMFVNLTSVDGQVLLPESVLSQLEVSVKHFRVKRTRNAEDDEEENHPLQSEHDNNKVENKFNGMHTEEQSTTYKNNDLEDHFNVSVTDEQTSPLHNKSYELKRTCQESRCVDNLEQQQKQQLVEKVQEQNETEKAALASVSKTDSELIARKHKHTCDNHEIAEVKENMDRTESGHIEESDVVYTPSQTSISVNITHAPIIKRSRVFSVDLGNVNRHITNNSNNLNDEDNKDSSNKINKKSKFDKNANKKLKGRGNNRSSNVIVTQGSDAVNALLQKKAMNDKW